jgi:5S rRNA maturation endonuclease (ribonuclease M5)
MRNLIVKYYNGGQFTLDEVVKILEEYMRVEGKTDTTIIQNMLKHPMSQMLLQKALDICIHRLKDDYSIMTVYDKAGHKLKTY